MYDEAYLALDAICKGADLAGREHWVTAFKAIRWAVETRDGVELTSAGRQAHEDMASERKSADPSFAVEQPTF